MKALLLFLVCTIALGVCASARADDMRIVVFGDSLTSGYQLRPDESFPSKLEKKLTDLGYQNIEVLNMSIAGETSTGGVDRLNAVLAVRPDIVVLELGSNDTMRGVSSALIHRNLATIIGRLQAEKIYVVLVGAKAPLSLGLSYVQQMEAVYKGLAEFYNVAFYPNALEGIAEQSEYNLADGLHPNPQGVDIMVEGIYRLVDAGLRWKWQVIQYQEQYKQQKLPEALLPPQQ